MWVPCNKVVFVIQKHSEGRKGRLMCNGWNFQDDVCLCPKNVTLVINIICNLYMNIFLSINMYRDDYCNRHCSHGYYILMEHQKLFKKIITVLVWTLQKQTWRWGLGDGDAVIGGCSRRPWKGSREAGPARKAARKAASLLEGDLRGQRGPRCRVKWLQYLDISLGGPRHSGYSQFPGKGGLQPEGGWGRQGWLLRGRGLHHGCRRRGQSPKHWC